MFGYLQQLDGDFAFGTDASLGEFQEQPNTGLLHHRGAAALLGQVKGHAGRRLSWNARAV